MNVPLDRLAKKYRHEREESDSEDDIPLMELSKHLKAREQSATENQTTDEEDTDYCHDQSLMICK